MLEYGENKFKDLYEGYMKKKIDNIILLLENFDINFLKLNDVLESRDSRSIDDELLYYLKEDFTECFGDYNFSALLVELQSFLFYIDEGKYVLDLTDSFSSKEVLLKKDNDYYILGVVSGQEILSYMSKHSSLDTIERNEDFTILDYNLLLNIVDKELSLKK